MPRGKRIVLIPPVGRPQNRAAHLAMYAHNDGCPYATTVEQAIIDQQTTKRAARAVSGADQRSRTEAKAEAARERRDNRGQAPARATGQMLLPID
jgi:hypothetical protein